MIKAFLLPLFFISTLSYATDELKRAVLDAKKVMMQRENEIIRLGNELNSLKVTVPKKQIIKPVTMDFGNETLHCVPGLFPWPLKEPNAHRKDCTFKLNIADENDIKKLYATLQLMKEQGWSVDKQEVYKQNRINDKNILNTERIRFIKE